MGEGASIKNVCTKSRKFDPFPHCPHWFSPLCPCGRTINFEKSKVFLHQKVRTSASEDPLTLVCKMSALGKPRFPSEILGYLYNPLRSEELTVFASIILFCEDVMDNPKGPQGSSGDHLRRSAEQNGNRS